MDSSAKAVRECKKGVLWAWIIVGGLGLLYYAYSKVPLSSEWIWDTCRFSGGINAQTSDDNSTNIEVELDSGNHSEINYSTSFYRTFKSELQPPASVTCMRYAGVVRRSFTPDEVVGSYAVYALSILLCTFVTAITAISLFAPLPKTPLVIDGVSLTKDEQTQWKCVFNSLLLSMMSIVVIGSSTFLPREIYLRLLNSPVVKTSCKIIAVKEVQLGDKKSSLEAIFTPKDSVKIFNKLYVGQPGSLSVESKIVEFFNQKLSAQEDTILPCTVRGENTELAELDDYIPENPFKPVHLLFIPVLYLILRWSKFGFIRSLRKNAANPKKKAA